MNAGREQYTHRFNNYCNRSALIRHWYYPGRIVIIVIIVCCAREIQRQLSRGAAGILEVVSSKYTAVAITHETAAILYIYIRTCGETIGDGVLRVGREENSKRANARILSYVLGVRVRILLFRGVWVSRKNPPSRLRSETSLARWRRRKRRRKDGRRRLGERWRKRRFYDPKDGENITCVAKALTPLVAPACSAITRRCRRHPFISAHLTRECVCVLRASVRRV